MYHPCTSPAVAQGWDYSKKCIREHQEQCFSAEKRERGAEAVLLLSGHPPALSEHLGIALRMSDPSLGRTGLLSHRQGWRRHHVGRSGPTARVTVTPGSCQNALVLCGSILIVTSLPEQQTCLLPTDSSFALGHLRHTGHGQRLISSNVPSMPLHFSSVLWIMKEATWTYLSRCLDWN